MHLFLLSDLPPLNLLGCVLMCRLSICVISTPEGPQVANSSDLLMDTLTIVHDDIQSPLYVYQWEVNQPLISPTSHKKKEVPCFNLSLWLVH